MRSRSIPTIDSSTWCATPARWPAASRFRVPVSKNAVAAARRMEVVLLTSITTGGRVQPGPGEDVHASRAGDHHGLVPGRPYLIDDEPAHQAGPAGHCYPHLPAPPVSRQRCPYSVTGRAAGL